MRKYPLGYCSIFCQRFPEKLVCLFMAIWKSRKWKSEIYDSEYEIHRVSMGTGLATQFISFLISCKCVCEKLRILWLVLFLEKNPSTCQAEGEACLAWARTLELGTRIHPCTPVVKGWRSREKPKLCFYRERWSLDGSKDTIKRVWFAVSF